MMFAIGLILAIGLGYSVLIRTTDGIQPAESLGLSFLIGMGLETIFMFLFDLIQLRFTALNLLALTIVLIAGLNWRNLRSFRRFKEWPRSLLKRLRKPDFRKINYYWLVLMLLLAFLLIVSLVKCIYWPTTAYDSVAGYDLFGKVMAAEGKIHVSLFELGVQGPRGIYPPLLQGSLSFAYLMGLGSSKIMMSLFYFSLVLVFYAQLRRYVNSTNAITFTLLMVVTPEMYAFASMSNTNVPAAAYAAPAIIYLFLWLDKRNKSFLYLASVLMGLNVWLRNDGVVFNLAGAILLFADAIRRKTYRELLTYGFIAFLPIVAWTLYLKIAIGIVQNRFVTHLFWDGGRFRAIVRWIFALLFRTTYFGITFHIFLAALILNFRNIFKHKINLLLLIVGSLLLYAAVYYQLDLAKQHGTLNAMMSKSFKRGLFFFVPLVYYYAAVNEFTATAFRWIEKVRTGEI